MDLVSHFERLIAHDQWANREVALGLRAQAEGEAARLLAHVVATELLWIDRIAARPQRCAVWPAWSLEETVARSGALAALWQELLRGASAPALDARVGYVNTQGQRFTNTVGDIVAHAMLHGSYHRGQIARALRQAGAQPAACDFIHAARQGFLDGPRA